MLAMAAASLLVGLGTNFFAAKPLPLLRPLVKDGPPATLVHFGEVDVDFVLQISADSGTLLLDARAAAAYRLGHIPGAASLPLGEFAESFPGMQPRLRQARLLVVYCSGWHCSDSSDLARLLGSKGLKNLLLYKGGMEDWNGKGHAVVK
jgi:rhodanese-related sulfurtransferase